MTLDVPVLAVDLIWDHTTLIFALMIFVGTLIYMFIKQTLLSPPGISLFVYAVASVFVLFPILIYSNRRDYILSTPCQLLILGIALTWAFAIIGFMRKPSTDFSYPPVQWRLLPQRVWLLLFSLICVLDPIITIARFGKIGLLYGNEMTGAGGEHRDVITAATVIGWEFGSVASTMLQTDFLVSGLNWKQFLFRRGKWLDLGLVLFCLACNSTTGNRFILIMNVMGFACGLNLFGRLRKGPAALALILLMVFFTIIGNYRVGRADLKEKLAVDTRIAVVDSMLSWVALYTEPIFPTLDAFVRNAPPPAWGATWLDNVGPSFLRGVVLNEERTVPIGDMYDLIPHFGMTFRTMYADLIFDFGPFGSVIVGTFVLFLSIFIYNTSTRSARHLSFLINTFHTFSFMAFLATFYTQVPFISAAILFFVSVHAPADQNQTIEIPAAPETPLI